MISHYEAMLVHYGQHIGVRAARKHLGWRLEGVPGGRDLRKALMRLEDPAEVVDRLRGFFADAAGAAA